MLVTCHASVSFVGGYELHKHLFNWMICGSHYNVHVVWCYVISCKVPLSNIIWQLPHLNAHIFNMPIKLRLLVMLFKSKCQHICIHLIQTLNSIGFCHAQNLKSTNLTLHFKLTIEVPHELSTCLYNHIVPNVSTNAYLHKEISYVVCT